jgi:hypothetical protein
MDIDVCACGIDNTQPRVWHKWTSNHLCRYHAHCNTCTEDNFALLINGAVEYLKGYNEIFPNGEQA